MHESLQPIGRRTFLLGAGAFVVALGWDRGRSGLAALVAQRPGDPELVKIVEFTDDGRRTGVVRVPKVVKTESEWKKQLSPASFEITRKEGTERPFSGSLLDVHDKGVFRCICCDTALYDSATKYESGTGWPSFWQPIAPENIVEKADTSSWHDPHRRLLPPLRRAPRACVRRRSQAHGAALLHELGRAAVREGGVA